MFTGLQQLDNLPMWDGSRFSPIEVPKRLLAALGNPQNVIPAVHVAGTNGKGSVCSLLAACFHAEGLSVGQFVSPHMASVAERCLINGSPVSLEDFDRSVREVIEAARGLGEEPSYFVVTMAAAFLQFAEKRPDRAVIEVGLGGLLDATNIIHRPLVSVITRIALDHTHVLGGTLEEIALNKAGIIKPGVPVVVGENAPEAADVCLRTAKAKSSPCHIFGRDYWFSPDEGILRWPGGSFAFAADELCGLAPFQIENRCTAVRTAVLLGLTVDSIRKGLRSARWPGRLEWLWAEGGAGRVQVLLDGMHNLNGAEAFAQYARTALAKRPDLKRIIVVFAVRSTKRWQEIAGCLQQSISECQRELEWICTGARLPYTVDPAELASALPASAAINDEKAALEEALGRADRSTLVLVVGSLYLIGALRPMLTDAPFLTIDDTVGSADC